MKNQATKLITTGIAGALFAANPTQAAVWDAGAGDGLWESPLNWADDAAPNGTVEITNGDTVTRGVNSTVSRTFVSGGSTLNVTGGTQSDNQAGNSVRNFVGRGSVGTLNVSGGSYDIGHLLSVGGGGANGNGKVYVSGGSLVVSRGSNAANLTTGVVGGYSLELGDDVAGNGDALFEISGGSFATRIGVGVGTTGTFSVVGSGASSIGIGSNGSLDGEWNQFAGGTLSATVDLTGITKIFIDDVDGGGVSVNFQAGSLLNLGFLGTPVAGTWTILEAEGTTFDSSTISGLSLTPSTASGWSYGFDNVGGNGLLTATYVIPEPSAALLGGLGLLALLRRRRD